jgi:hypothetical protein
MRGLIFLLADSQSRAPRGAAAAGGARARAAARLAAALAGAARGGLTDSSNDRGARLWGRSGPTTAAGTWADGRRGSAAACREAIRASSRV